MLPSVAGAYGLDVCCTPGCSGRHNPEIAAELFPHWPEERRTAFSEEKEQRFRDMAGGQIWLLQVMNERLFSAGCSIATLRTPHNAAAVLSPS